MSQCLTVDRPRGGRLSTGVQSGLWEPGEADETERYALEQRLLAQTREQEQRRASHRQAALGPECSAPLNSLAASYTIRSRMRQDRSRARSTGRQSGCSTVPHVEIHVKDTGSRGREQGAPHYCSSLSTTLRSSQYQRPKTDEVDAPSRSSGKETSTSPASRCGAGGTSAESFTERLVAPHTSSSMPALPATRGAGSPEDYTCTAREEVNTAKCEDVGSKDSAMFDRRGVAPPHYHVSIAPSTETALLNTMRSSFLNDLGFADRAEPQSSQCSQPQTAIDTTLIPQDRHGDSSAGTSIRTRDDSVDSSHGAKARVAVNPSLGPLASMEPAVSEATAGCSTSKAQEALGGIVAARAKQIEEAHQARYQVEAASARARYRESVAALQSRLLTELTRLAEEAQRRTSMEIATLVDGAASFYREYVVTEETQRQNV
eukprot:scaffold314000_cov36-Tisochrysis_lutea.AAC.1